MQMSEGENSRRWNSWKNVSTESFLNSLVNIVEAERWPKR